MGDVQRQLLLGAQRQYALQALRPDDEEFVTIGKRKRPSLLDDLKPVIVQVARSSLLLVSLIINFFVYDRFNHTNLKPHTVSCRCASQVPGGEKVDMKLRVRFAAKYYAIFHVTFSFRRGGVDISVATRLKRMDHPELCDCFELDHLAKLIEDSVGVFNNDVDS